MLALCTLINPGDEVIVFDPWFVMYRHLTTLAGGNIVQVSTYPDFRNSDRRRSQGHHAENQSHSVQQPGQSDRSRGVAGGSAGTGGTGGGERISH